MKRLPWKLKASKLDLGRVGIPESWVLVPETKNDEEELRVALDSQDVRHRMSFIKNGINGRVDFPQQLRWSPEGSLKVSIAVQGGGQPLEAWFWIVETDDGTGRRHAFWGTVPDTDQAVSWT